MKTTRHKPTAKGGSKATVSRSGSRSRWKIGALAAVVFGVIGFSALRLSVAMTVSEASAIRFTMGSQSIKTADGKVWSAAGYVADGTPFVSPAPVQGTLDQPLYQTQRSGITYLKVPHLPHGHYKVLLLFADTESTAKGQRVFDLYSEGEKKEDGLDIFRKAGEVASRAYTYNFTTDVKDGELDLEFRPVAGTPVLSAVELVPRKLDSM